MALAWASTPILPGLVCAPRAVFRGLGCWLAYCVAQSAPDGHDIGRALNLPFLRVAASLCLPPTAWVPIGSGVGYLLGHRDFVCLKGFFWRYFLLAALGCSAAPPLLVSHLRLRWRADVGYHEPEVESS